MSFPYQILGSYHEESTLIMLDMLRDTSQGSSGSSLTFNQFFDSPYRSVLNHCWIEAPHALQRAQTYSASGKWPSSPRDTVDLVRDGLAANNTLKDKTLREIMSSITLSHHPELESRLKRAIARKIMFHWIGVPNDPNHRTDIATFFSQFLALVGNETIEDYFTKPRAYWDQYFPGALDLFWKGRRLGVLLCYVPPIAPPVADAAAKKMMPPGECWNNAQGRCQPSAGMICYDGGSGASDWC